ncbi:MAG: Dps family protein [Candidatus Nitrosocosmicus sp.]
MTFKNFVYYYMAMLEGQVDKLKESVDIGIEESSVKGVVTILNTLLADEYVLYTKTRNYHWNVVGKDFKERHEFFQEQYEKLDEMIDEIAERTRQLGGLTVATLNEFLKSTNLKENPGDYPSDLKMISNLLGDHETTIKYLRKSADVCEKKYHDMGTNDFLIGLMEKHEKMAWMLRAHVD